MEGLKERAARIAGAVLERLQKPGIWLGEVDEVYPMALNTPVLAVLARTPIAGNFVFGSAGT